MDVPGLISVDDVVSFDISSSNVVLIPIPLVLKPLNTETQRIATIQSPYTHPSTATAPLLDEWETLDPYLSYFQILKMITLSPSSSSLTLPV